MPESTDDAAILIAISHQAHERMKEGNQLTVLCDCTVMVVFAGFFIEANLNHIIIDVMNKKQEMLAFWGRRKDNVGLQNKLAWYYNLYIAPQEINLKGLPDKEKEKLKKELYENLGLRFPGFGEIYNFRNKISHGNIVKSTANPESAERLRLEAKKIVDELFVMAERAIGHTVPRTTIYYDAIS